MCAIQSASSALIAACAMLTLAACGGSDGGSVSPIDNSYGSELPAESPIESSVQRNADSSPLPTNAKPSIAGSPPAQVTVGDTYSFTPAAYDVDGDQLAFRIERAPSWAEFDTKSGRLSGAPSESDIGLVTDIKITVSDGHDDSSLPTFSIMVVAKQNLNTPPQISGTPESNALVDSEYDFYPDAFDLDGDKLTFSVTNKPSWAQFDNGTGRLSGTPSATDIGPSRSITITASDGKATNELGPFTIIVQSGEPANSAPIISGKPLSVIAVGETYQFFPEASDDDGDTLTFSINNKPSWATFDSKTGVLAGIPTDSDLGAHKGIQIFLSDAYTSSALQPFSIEVVPKTTATREARPGHYIALNRDDNSTAMLDAATRSGVQGVQKRFYWKQLEPYFDTYDFSAIQSDLDLLANKGKRLVVFLEGKTFTGVVPTRPYLEAEYTLANRAGGYTAKRWDPYVTRRFNKLIAAIGAQFDDHPAFEGVAIQETALSLNNEILNNNGYTPEKYRDELIKLLTQASADLPTSQIFWYQNFLAQNQSYIKQIIVALAPHGVIVGGPDVLPDVSDLEQLAYPLYAEFKDDVSLFNSIQYDSYYHVHKDTTYPTKYWTMQELYVYARDQLHVDYLFWTRKKFRDHPDSYSWLDALPVIEGNPNIN